MATRLFTEIKRLGYTGCYTHLARFVAGWQRGISDEGGETRQRATPDYPTTAGSDHRSAILATHSRGALYQTAATADPAAGDDR